MKKILLSLLALIFVLVSCVKDEVAESLTLPSIDKVSLPAGAITPSDAVLVTATITDAMGTVTGAQIKYSVNGTAQTAITMAKASAKDTYTGTIPKQADKAVVVLSVVATNSAGKSSESGTSTYTVGAIPIDYTVIKLNEVNGNIKFIELYNTSASSVDISGMKVQKDGADYATINAGSTIAAKGFAIIGADAYSGSAAVVATGNGGLSGKKALKLELFTPDATSVDIFTRTTTNDIAAKSMSRYPDGVGSWWLADETIDKANAASTTPIPLN